VTRLLTRIALGAGLAALLILVACSGPVLDPTGTYSGNFLLGGSTLPATSVISGTSAANSWDHQLNVTGAPYSGTCTHDPSGTANNLTCTFADSGLSGSMVGTLNGNTYSGNWSDDAAESGTFSMTRP